jgi:hypothetical protein
LGYAKHWGSSGLGFTWIMWALLLLG